MCGCVYNNRLTGDLLSLITEWQQVVQFIILIYAGRLRYYSFTLNNSKEVKRCVVSIYWQQRDNANRGHTPSGVSNAMQSSNIIVICTAPWVSDCSAFQRHQANQGFLQISMEKANTYSSVDGWWVSGFDTTLNRSHSPTYESAPLISLLYYSVYLALSRGVVQYLPPTILTSCEYIFLYQFRPM